MKYRCVIDFVYEDVNNCYERVFVFMYKVGVGLGDGWEVGFRVYGGG